MLPLRTNNPLAPPALNGLSSIGPYFEDEDFCKTQQYTIPFAYQELLGQTLLLDRDADYLVTVIYGIAGQFGIRIYDQSDYYLSDTYWIPPDVTPAGLPDALLPIPMRFARGSSIMIDLVDTSGTNNQVVTVLFRGIKHYTARPVR